GPDPRRSAPAQIQAAALREYPLRSRGGGCDPLAAAGPGPAARDRWTGPVPVLLSPAGQALCAAQAAAQPRAQLTTGRAVRIAGPRGDESYHRDSGATGDPFQS